MLLVTILDTHYKELFVALNSSSYLKVLIKKSYKKIPVQYKNKKSHLYNTWDNTKQINVRKKTAYMLFKPYNLSFF